MKALTDRPNLPKVLSEIGTMHIFPINQHIFRPDQTIRQCYLILSGTVKIYIDHKNGRRSILDFVGKGDWIGELSIFGEETDIKENTVVQEVTCLAFDVDALRQLCRENADVSFYFASYTARKLVIRSHRMSEYLNYSLEKRLAEFIMEHENEGVYKIPHTEVAEYLNVSYRHVLYGIKGFCDAGLLSKTAGRGKGYAISDKSGLRRIGEL
jgi:CRP-like cAMP-binding protein